MGALTAEQARIGDRQRGHRRATQGVRIGQRDVDPPVGQDWRGPRCEAPEGLDRPNLAYAVLGTVTSYTLGSAPNEVLRVKATPGAALPSVSCSARARPARPGRRCRGLLRAVRQRRTVRMDIDLVLRVESRSCSPGLTSSVWGMDW